MLKNCENKGGKNTLSTPLAGLFFCTLSTFASANEATLDIRHIKVHGANTIPVSMLNNIDKSQIDADTSLSDIQKLNEDIKIAYISAGILGTTVYAIPPQKSEHLLNIYVEEPIVEEDSFVVEKIRFKGITSFQLPQIKELSSSFTGDVYDVHQMMRLRRHLQKLYTQNGYAKPRISLPQTNDNKQVVTFTVRETGKKKVRAQKLAPKVQQKRSIQKLTLSPPSYTPSHQHLEEAHRGVFVFTQKPEPEKKVQPQIKPQPLQPLPVKPQKVETQEIILEDHEEPNRIQMSSGFELVERSDDDLLILEVIIDGERRSRGVVAYQDYINNTLLLPLTELSEALNFHIQTTPEEGLASGFFIQEANTFSLNMQQQEVTVLGERKTFPAQKIEANYDDIYIASDIFQEWFPVTVTMKHAEQRLYIETKTELPYQSFNKRRNIWQSTQEKRTVKEIDAPTKDLERRYFSAPSVRLDNSLSFSRNGENDSGQNNLNIEAQGDFLKMAGKVTGNVSYGSKNKMETRDIRTHLSKVSEDSDMLGFMNASQIELGDVTLPALPLLSGVTSGRGAFISNKPINAVRDPDNITIDGSATPSWDVEVYQDDYLVDFQTVDETGEYHFSTIPLKVGKNTFTVKLFGPNGETQNYTEEYFLGPNMLKKGSFYYDIMGLESSAPVIQTSDKDSFKNGNISTQVEYGLSRNISLRTGIYRGELSNVDQSQTAYSTGFNAAYKNLFTQGDFLQQSNDAQSYKFSAKSNLFNGYSANYNFQQNIGYGDENELRTRKGVSLSKTYQFTYLPTVQLRFTGDESKFSDGRIERDYGQSTSFSYYGIRFSNELNASKVKANETNSSYSGNLSLSGKYRASHLRGRVNYNLKSDAGIKLLDLRGNHQFNGNMHANFGLSQTFGSGSTSRLDGQLTWRLNKADLSLNAGTSSNGDSNVGVRVSTFILPSESGYTLHNSHQASFGGIQANIRAFIDSNNNGQYDEGEETIPNVAFHYRQRGKVSITDENGIAILTGLTPFNNNVISLDTNSLEDIYISPIHSEINIKGDPAQVGYIDYPLTIHGEVNGLLTALHKNGSEKELKNITLHLVDSNGKRVASAISEFDGYYNFTHVPMGIFKLKIDTTDAKLAKVEQLRELPSVTLTTDKPFEDGLFIQLKALENGVK